jgi:hypothetical protein
MVKGLGDNPIWQRLTRERSRVSLRGAIRIGIVLWLSSLGTGLYSFLANRGRWTPVNTLLLDVAWTITLLSPLAITAAAAILTARDGRSQLGQLARISLLPDSTLMQGYLFSTLYRSRLLLATFIGLSPILVIGMMQLHIRYRFATICYPGSSCNVSAVMTPPHVVGPLVSFACVIIGVMGLNWLGALLGVGLALLVRRAAEITIAFVGLVYAIGAALLVMVTARSVISLPYDNLLTVLAFVLPAWIPYSLAVLATRAVVRQFAATPILA